MSSMEGVPSSTERKASSSSRKACALLSGSAEEVRLTVLVISVDVPESSFFNPSNVLVTYLSLIHI